jgi:hypothetical protein
MTYEDMVRNGNWIYLLRLQKQTNKLRGLIGEVTANFCG